jgi:hypothetical protein
MNFLLLQICTNQEFLLILVISPATIVAAPSVPKSAKKMFFIPPTADLQGTFLPDVNEQAIFIFFILKRAGVHFAYPPLY